MARRQAELSTTKVQARQSILSGISGTGSIHKILCLNNTTYLEYLNERWANFSETHVCALLGALKQTCITREVIDSGVFIKFRRRLVEFLMISQKHPYTSMVFKSISEIKHEEVKHLVNHKNMIHPFSMFCLYYEFFMTMSTIFYLIYILPTDIHYRIYYRSIKWMKFAFDMQMTLHILITFYIGYLDKENMCIYMNQSLVARCYVKRLFIWDILSCVPSYLIFLYVLPIPSKDWKAMKWLSLLRIARIPTIERALKMLFGYYKVPAEVYIAVQIILRSQVVILCCMTLIAGLSTFTPHFYNITEEVDKLRAKELIFDTLRSVVGVGKLYISYTYLEAISRILITAVSLILNFWITAKLYILWQRYLVLSEVGEDHYQQLAGFLNYKGLPPHIRKDIYCFYEFKFQTKFFDESTIYSMLSDNFKKEVPKYRLDRSIIQIRFLRLLPNPMIAKVAAHMEILYHCPGDVIFKVNGSSTNLYLIQIGTVALHDEYGIEVCHLEDGAYYGDMAVVLKLIHTTSMTAISPCKISLLKHNVLMQILDKEPDIKEYVLELSGKLHAERRNDWVENPLKSQRSVSLLESSKPERKRGSFRFLRPSTTESWV